MQIVLFLVNNLALKKKTFVEKNPPEKAINIFQTVIHKLYFLLPIKYYFFSSFCTIVWCIFYSRVCIVSCTEKKNIFENKKKL